MKREESMRLNEQIIEYYKEGLKISEIAEKLDIPRASVNERLSRIRKEEGLAKRNNIGTVGSFVRVSDEEFKTCMDAGLTSEEIAEKFNLTIGIINLKLKRIMG